MVEHDSRGIPKYLPIFIHAIEQVNDSIANKAVEVKMFSDSIVLSAALNPQNVVDVALAVSELQRCFLREGILLRGGIAMGKHFSTPTVIFSQGLVAAYHIESKIARFPRVVMSEDLLNYFWHAEETTPEMRDKIRAEVVSDRDGAKLIHYLGNKDQFEALREKILITVSTKTSPSETIIEKIRWLFDYHNYCAAAHGFQPLTKEAAFPTDFSSLEDIK